MEGIQFEEDLTDETLRRAASQPSLFARWVLKTGIVATPEAADKVLMVIVLFLLLSAACIMWYGFTVPEPLPLPPDSFIMP